MLSRSNNINKGEVKDPYAKSIMGVGSIGVGPYKVDCSPSERMIYSRWRGILDRCYVKKERRKTVHFEWHRFQYFAAWFTAEFYLVPYNTMYDIRSMADEYQNILPPHVYFWQLRIIECFEHSKIFQKS